MSSYSQIGGHSVTRTDLKYENVHKAQTAQKYDSKTQTIRTTTAQQKYRLGTISNLKLLGGGGWLKPVLQAPNLTLIFCSDLKQLVSCSVLVMNL